MTPLPGGDSTRTDSRQGQETFTADNRVIEYVDSEFRGDRFQFYTHLEGNTGKHPYIFQRSLIGGGQQED